MTRRASTSTGFENSSEAQNIHIYNNTHFIREGLDVHVFPEDRTPINSRFENNIFFFEGRGSVGQEREGVNTSFRNNLYFNIPVHKSETRPIVADPLFVQPGLAGTDIDLKTMKSLLGYQLKPASPCIDTGLPIVVGESQRPVWNRRRRGSNQHRRRSRKPLRFASSEGPTLALAQQQVGSGPLPVFNVLNCFGPRTGNRILADGFAGAGPCEFLLVLNIGWRRAASV